MTLNIGLQMKYNFTLRSKEACRYICNKKLCPTRKPFLLDTYRRPIGYCFRIDRLNLRRELSTCEGGDE